MDIHFNSYKVKYDMLEKSFRPIVNSQKINSINIFINLDDVIHKLHRPMVNNEFQVAGDRATLQVVANVLNLMAHYKQWAVTRYGIKCKIYCIYTSAQGNFKNNIYTEYYRKKFIEATHSDNTNYFYINNAMIKAMPILKTFCRYIENVYVIDSKFIEPSCIPLFISNDTVKADWNIMISRDFYDLQYPILDKWTYISPKGDNSRIINNGDIWNYIYSRENIEGIELNNYDTSLLLISLATVGDKYRNIPRVKKIGWKTMFKILNKVHTRMIEEGVSNTTARLMLIEELGIRKADIEMINRNLMVTDIERQVYNLGDIEKAHILSHVMDYSDKGELERLNKTYFANYPINIGFLKKEVKYSPSPFGFIK